MPKVLLLWGTKMKKFNFENKIKGFDNTYFLETSDTQNDDIKIEIKPKENITIVELITSQKDVKREIFVGDDATLTYIKVAKSKELSNVSYKNTLGERANLNLFCFDFGSCVNKLRTTLDKEDSIFKLFCLIDLKNDSKVVNDLENEHFIKSTSDIIFRHILDDSSNSKLSMNSIVQNSAPFTKAVQNSKAILLSDKARVAVSPFLELFVDELEAKHGASFGDLDKDAIYYLQSRGIKEKDAKAIMLEAVRTEVYANLEDEKLIEYIKSL